MQLNATDRAIRHIHKAAIAGAVTLSISAPSIATGVLVPSPCEIPPDQPLVVNALESSERCDNQITLAEAVSFANEIMGLDTITFHESLANTVIPANNIYVREGVTIQGHEDASSITLQATDRRIFSLGSGKQPKFLLKNLTLETETEITHSLIYFVDYGGKLTLDNIRTTENTKAHGIFEGTTNYDIGRDINLTVKNSQFHNSIFDGTAITASSYSSDIEINIKIENSEFKNIQANSLISSKRGSTSSAGNNNITLKNTVIDGGQIGRKGYEYSDQLIVSASDKSSSIIIEDSVIKNINKERDDAQHPVLLALIKSEANEQANLAIKNSSIRSNTASMLGAVFSEYGSALTNILDSQVHENSLYSSGFFSTVWNGSSEKSGSINILRSSISRNMDASGIGGEGDISGMVTLWEGQLNIDDSSISHNGFNAINGVEPNILSVSNSTISHNKSRVRGAGINIYTGHKDGTSVTVKNSTISHNAPTEVAKSYAGSGIAFYTNGDEEHINANLSNVTITENKATGIIVNDGNEAGEGITVNIDNSIIANNHTSEDSNIHTDRDLSGNFNVTSSLIGNTTTAGHTTINGVKISEANNENGNNLLGADAKLSPLQESAGMLVHQLQADSPAISAGTINPDTISKFDQRGEGFPRVRETTSGNELDLGAVQYYDKPVAVNDVLEVLHNTGPHNVKVSENDVRGSHGLALDLGSLTILQYPNHSKASANRDGSITYTPEAGFVGEDSLTYQIADVSGQYSNEATLSLKVVEPTENETDDEVDNSSGGGPLNALFIGLLSLLSLSRTRSKAD